METETRLNSFIFFLNSAYKLDLVFLCVFCFGFCFSELTYLCLIEPDYIWSKEAISYIQQSVWQQPSLSTFLVTVGDIRQVSIFQASSNNIIMFSYLHLVLTFKANVTYDSTPFLVASFNNV